MNATNTCPERLSAIIPPPASLRTHRTATRTLSTSTPATVPAAGPKAAPDIPRVEPGPSRSGRGRRLFFRCVRLALAGGVLVGAGLHALHTFTSVTSEQAYVNAEMTVLRSPIDGELRLEPVQTGTFISRGATLFHIENARVGNQESMSQLNWVRELAERLRAEADECEVRYRQQEQVYQLHARLHQEQLISKLDFIEEDTKLALARTALDNKQAQVRQAEARLIDAERHVELQKEAMVQMPFDGVAWTISARSGAEVAAREPVLQVVDPRQIHVDAFFHERHAGKLRVGARVSVRALDGRETWQGRVESVRGGVGRIAYDNFAGGLPGDFTRRRLAARVAMDSANPYPANQFFGVGRSVVVTLNDHE